MKQDKLYTERIEIKVTKTMKKVVLERAKASGRTMNQWIREAIEDKF